MFRPEKQDIWIFTDIYFFLNCTWNESVKKPCVFESIGDIQNAVIMSLSLSYQNMNVWNAP